MNNRPSWGASRLARSAVIAALYAVLALSPSPFGALQLRLSEALTVLPFFYPEAIAGLTLGCIIVNLFSPFGIIDIVFGSFATLLGALVTYFLGKRFKKSKAAFYLAPLPSVVSNAFIIGGILFYMLSSTDESAPYLTFVSSIGVSQFFSCYILGLPFLLAVRKYKARFDGFLA